MKKLLLGIAVAAAAVYIIKKLRDEDKLDELEDDVRRYTSKAKKKAKDMMDYGMNQAEYLGERAEQEFQKGKRCLKQMR